MNLIFFWRFSNFNVNRIFISQKPPFQFDIPKKMKEGIREIKKAVSKISANFVIRR